MKTLKCLLIMLVSSFLGSAYAEESKQAKIDRAVSAAPESVSAKATVMDVDGTVLRQGSNGWTCLPDVFPGDKSPICNDATWMKAMQAMGKQAPFTPDRIGISYMLKGDVNAGVSNADPFHANRKTAEDYVETGPHLMIMVPKDMLGDIPTDPSAGGPYVMWGDTPYAHIMIPVDNTKVLMPNHKH
jgi:hypothetical protein